MTFDGSTLYVTPYVTIDNGVLTLDTGTSILGYDSNPDQVFSYDAATKPTIWSGPNKTLVTPTILGGITELIDQNTLDTDYVAISPATQGTILTMASAGEAFSTGQLLFLSSSGKWFIADADAEATAAPLLGIATRDSNGANDSTAILLEGHYSTTTYHDQITAPAKAGAPLYVSTTAGNVTQVAPTGSGDIVRLIGHNIYGQSGRANVAVIRFKPDNTWVEL